MIEDFEELFPYIYVKMSDDQPDHFLLMIASRTPFDGDQIMGQLKILDGTEDAAEISARIEAFVMWDQPPASRLLEMFEGIVPFFADEVNYDERFLAAYLSLLIEGQMSPHSLPPLQEIS